MSSNEMHRPAPTTFGSRFRLDGVLASCFLLASFFSVFIMCAEVVLSSLEFFTKGLIFEWGERRRVKDELIGGVVGPWAGERRSWVFCWCYYYSFLSFSERW
jgi:hypothetical protein